MFRNFTRLIQEDEIKLAKTRNIVGWAGRNRSHKKYVTFCLVCAKDRELFGYGVFSSVEKYDFFSKYSCACIRQIRWTKEQYKIKLTRVLSAQGREFLGFREPWKGNETKVIVSCFCGNTWDTGNIDKTLHGRICPVCAREATRQGSIKGDEEHIRDFMATGVFPVGTRFVRMEDYHWGVICPICENDGVAKQGGRKIFPSYISSLKKGIRPCRCNVEAEQVECYLHNFYNAADKLVAIKYGISRYSEDRLRSLRSVCRLRIENIGVWVFPNAKACHEAERLSHLKFFENVLSPKDIDNGYTETTLPENTEGVIEIYRSLGGILDRVLD